jgi:hypothetical protein
MNAPISPCLALLDEEPVANQAQQSNDWYCFVDQFSQDTRCPVCEGVGHTRKYRRCPQCRGAGEIQPSRMNTHNPRLDYTTACHQARRLLRRARVNPRRNSTQFATTSQDVLRLTIHLPRPYDQPLFCLSADGRHSQRIAEALARTLLQQGHAV